MDRCSSAGLRVVRRRGNRPRSEPRESARESAEEILAARKLNDVVDCGGPEPEQNVGPSERRKPIVQPSSTTPSPQSMCRLNAAGSAPAPRTALERMGRQHRKHPVSGRFDGGGRREGHSTLEAQVGFRVPRRAERGCAANDGRRPCVCRFAKRHGLRFERRHRLYSLALSSRFRRTGCRNHRQHRDELGPAVRSFHWRPIRQRLRRRCRDRSASVDNEGG